MLEVVDGYKLRQLNENFEQELAGLKEPKKEEFSEIFSKYLEQLILLGLLEDSAERLLTLYSRRFFVDFLYDMEEDALKRMLENEDVVRFFLYLFKTQADEK